MSSTSSARAPRLHHLVTFALVAVFLAACSSESEPLTAENLIERTTAAQREALTFRFEWESAPTGDGPSLYEGAIEYGDDGEVAALLLRSWAESGELVEEQRYVDGTLYSMRGGSPFTVRGADAAERFVGAWDWAAATELDDPKLVTEVGDDTIDGVDVVELEVTFEEQVVTYWVDADDHVLRSVTSSTQNGLPRSETSAYGDPVHIEKPLIVED